MRSTLAIVTCLALAACGGPSFSSQDGGSSATTLDSGPAEAGAEEDTSTPAPEAGTPLEAAPPDAQAEAAPEAGPDGEPAEAAAPRDTGAPEVVVPVTCPCDAQTVGTQCADVGCGLTYPNYRCGSTGTPSLPYACMPR